MLARRARPAITKAATIATVSAEATARAPSPSCSGRPRPAPPEACSHAHGTRGWHPQAMHLTCYC
jgi:hypothetical protein